MLNRILEIGHAGRKSIEVLQGITYSKLLQQTTPSVPNCTSLYLCPKSNFPNFDQVYRKTFTTSN
jgi:hypothetical protein